MNRGQRARLAILALAGAATVCGGSPSKPSAAPLPLAQETANFRFFYSPGDAVDAPRQEAFHAWAVQRLRVTVPRKIDYRKYTSRQDMGARTGHYDTNGYAEPETFTIHTLWSWDNHETVHVYAALVGRPSDFFNEGIAVAFQTDPLAGDYQPRFNGVQVHDAVRSYRSAGVLPLPLSGIVTTTGFRGISDSVLSYREAGSFVAFLVDRYGMEPLLGFFQRGGRDDSLATIRVRFEEAFGATLEEAEAAWLAFVG